MRRRIDSDSFNKEVLSQINRLRQALDVITPENIKYFDDELIRKARGVVNATDEYKWGNKQNINGISVRTVKRLVDDLKLRKQEFVVLETFANKYEATHIVGEEESEKSLLMNAVLSVPEKFDGRNSFVYYLITEDMRPLGKTITEKYINPTKFVNNIYPTSIKVAKQKRKIQINMALPVTYSYAKYVRIFAFVWRTK